MTVPTILANAKIILGDDVVHGSLVFENGTITAIDHGRAMPDGAIDCDGDYVAPGLVELHTDNLERHLRPRPSASWPHNAAIVAHDAELASTGITTVFDAVRLGFIEEAEIAVGLEPYARPMVSEILAAREEGLLKISHHIHLRAEICSSTLADELALFTPEDRVGIISLMDHTPGQRQFADISQYERYVCGRYGLSKKEFDDHVAERKALREHVHEKHEKAAVDAARAFGAVLASHDDTTHEHVEISARFGIKLAEFPTTIGAAHACHQHDIAIMMGAPNLVRGGSHSGNVAAHTLAEHDLLDIVSSDYVPSALLYSAIKLAQLWDDLPRALATVTHAPARATHLDDRGILEIGKRADIIRFRLANDVPLLRGVWSNGSRVA